MGAVAVALGLEADGVDRRVDHRLPDDLLDLVAQRGVLGQVDRLAAEAPGLRQPIAVHVTDDHDGGAEQLCGMRRREADRARAGDVHRRSGRHACRHAAVVAGREDVRQHRQVEDLLHRLVLVGELQEVPVGVRDQHVLGLAADPAAHVDVAVRRAGPVGVDVLADARVALLAVAAAAAGDVEGHRAQVALVDVLDVRAGLDHLSGDLVTEDQPRGRRRAAPDHVLVRPADVRRDDLEDGGVRQLAPDVGRVHPRPVLELEGREVDVLDLHRSRAHVGNASVVSHG